jgi:hypothetical protein
MCGLHNDSTARELDHSAESTGNLLCQTLLNLESSGEHFDNSCDFGKPDDVAVSGNVSDVHLELLSIRNFNSEEQGGSSYLSSKWHKMVLAKREEFKVSHNDHLAAVFGKHGAVHNGSQRLFVTLGEEKHRFGISLWSFAQALTVWVLSETLQDCLHCT